MKPLFVLLVLLTSVCVASVAQSVVEIPLEAISTNVPLTEVKPVEIEIIRSTEMPTVEGCKDLCGDGVCQEIVCMAIGCPCPETPASCPADCQAPMHAVQPVVAFPAEAKVVISPGRENPISVNDVPVEFKTEEQSPKVYVEVEARAATTAVTIQIDKESKLISIEHENITAVTKEAIKVEEKTIKVETPKGYIEVNVLPADATQVAISRTSQEIKRTELKVVDDKLVYETAGERKARLLWLIQVTVPVKTTVDAQTGSVTKVEQPWWSFLTV